MVIILDDRTDVWGNIDNLININAFFFFKEEKNRLNYVKEKFLKDDDDQILFSISLLLKFIHQAFFSYHAKFGSACDVRLIKREKMRMIFRNLNAVYLEDPYINISETYEFNTILNFGGNLDNKISNNTNSIITDYTEYNGIINIKLEINETLKEKFQVINKYWIYFCNIFFCNLNKNEFLYGNLKPNTYYSQKLILDNNLERINKFYSVNDANIYEFINEIYLKFIKKENNF